MTNSRQRLENGAAEVMHPTLKRCDTYHCFCYIVRIAAPILVFLATFCSYFGLGASSMHSLHAANRRRQTGCVASHYLGLSPTGRVQTRAIGALGVRRGISR